MYRNDWDAAVARATALEGELRQAQAAQSQDHQQIAALTAQLQQARSELARLQSGMPQAPNPYAQQGFGQQPYGQMPYGYAMPSYVYPNRGGTVLVLGILSLVVCSIMGPIAWSMGSEELRRIDAGQAPPDGRGNANAGKICGIISSILMIVMVVFVVFAFIMAASAEHHHSSY
jgi:hypothetical protein